MIPLHVTAWEFFLVALLFFVKWFAIGAVVVFAFKYGARGFGRLREWAHGVESRHGWYHPKNPQRGLAFDVASWTLLGLTILFAVCLGAAAIEHNVAPDKYKATPEAVR